MPVRTLDSPPRLLPLYGRIAAAMLPGARRAPFVPGGGGEIPDLELRLKGVEAERERVAAYAEVCGFPLRDTLPATYPHILAFGLHMRLMADGSFPFGAIGLVHLSNRIVQHRPILTGERLDLTVRASGLAQHPKGRSFSILTEARSGEETVWEETSTMLRRGGGGGGSSSAPEEAPGPTAEWRLPGDLGRRYAAVSGDRNPIHLHSLTAKPFGFARPIAHGMWTKARCLATLEPRLPDSFSVETTFRKPLPLPAIVCFGSADRDGGIRFAVRGRGAGALHLDGRIGMEDGS
jgi:acyl dehydratase